jgi:hypothetical protein
VRENDVQYSTSPRLSALAGAILTCAGDFFGVVGSSCRRLSARGGASLKCEIAFFGDELSFSCGAFLGERDDDNRLDEPDPSSDPESSSTVGRPEQSLDSSSLLLLRRPVEKTLGILTGEIMVSSTLCCGISEREDAGEKQAFQIVSRQVNEGKRKPEFAS